MLSLQSKLQQIGTAFSGVLENCFHYWRPVKKVPCLVWAETGEGGSFHSGNSKSEQVISGTCDLFTKREFDPLVDSMQDTLEKAGLAWRLDTVDYEDETNLIHYSWTWEVAAVGEISDWDGD